VRLDWRRAARAGLLLREDRDTGRAVLLVLDRRARQAGIGTAWRKAFGQYAMDTRHRYCLQDGELEAVGLEVVARSEGVDWFLDGALVYTTVHEDTPSSGRLGFFAEAGEVRLDGLEVVKLAPEAPAAAAGSQTDAPAG
jgi:hypothetical protein